LDITKLIFAGENDEPKKVTTVEWKKIAPGDISGGLWG
jgi:hypothetical protein